MKHIQDIRHSLKTALARLNELELSLTNKTAAAYQWDVDTIAECVAKEFGFAKEMFHARSLPRPVTYARQAAMFLMSKHIGLSATEVCTHFRHDMHISIYYAAMKSVMDKMEIDPIYSGKVVRAETAYLIQKNNK